MPMRQRREGEKVLLQLTFLVGFLSEFPKRDNNPLDKC